MVHVKLSYYIFLSLFVGSLLAQEWNLLGPTGGSIHSLSINPKNPSSLYASTKISGLFYSFDSGQSASFISHQFRDYDIDNIITLGDSDDSFICHVSGTGYFKLNGRTKTWKMIIDDPWGGGYTINPKNSNIMYISRNENQLWRSDDGGDSWYKLYTFDDPIRIIEVSNSDTSLIYAAFEDAIYRSVNSGRNWTLTSDPDFYDGIPIQLEINPLDNNSIYLNNNSRLLKSTDTGFSFDTLITSNTGSFVVNPVDTMILYVGTSNPSIAPEGGIFKSVDGGYNWFEVRNGLPDGSLMGFYYIVMNPLNPEELFAGVGYNGIFRTTDGGTNWQLTKLANTEVYNFHLISSNSERIITEEFTPRNMLTENNGVTWSSPSFEPNLLYDQTPVYQLSINQNDRNLGYLAGDSSLYRTLDGGTHWFSTEQLPGVVVVEYHPYNSSIVFAVVNDDYGISGCYRSNNEGESWDRIGELNDTIPSYRVYSPHNHNNIFGYGYSFSDRDSYIYRSTDLGENWERFGEGLIIWSETQQVADIYSLAISSADSNVFYCGQWGGLSKSIDGGESWFRADSALDVHKYFKVSSILLDESDPNRIYIGTLSSGIPYHPSLDNGGLYLSEDDCQSWTKVYDGEVTLIKSDTSIPRNIYINTPFGILTHKDNFTTQVSTHDITTLTEYRLNQNYPNPFNPTTKITFSLPKSETVILEVFNTLGQRIELLLNEKLNAGTHDIEFNATNLSSGLYFYRIESGDYHNIKKMILLK